MDWRAKAELYEQMRREYELGVGSVIGVARMLGVHRRIVREAVRNAVPTQRNKTERAAVKMAAAVSLIDSILELDRKGPRKQRHTARRIYDLIRTEVTGMVRRLIFPGRSGGRFKEDHRHAASFRTD